MKLEQLPKDTQHFIQNELENHERVEWVAQPLVMRLFVRSLPIFIFAIPWTVFATFMFLVTLTPIFGEGADSQSGATMGIVGAIFMSMFVIVGFGMLSIPFFTYRNARNTAYVITDERVLIFTPTFKSVEVNSYAPNQVATYNKKIRKDGSGDIIFKYEVTYDSDGDKHTKNLGFEALADVQSAQQAIDELVEQHKALKSAS